MAFLTYLCFLSFFALANAVVGECDPSPLGYQCMKSLADYYNVHWTLQSDDLYMALEGIGAEWVGFSFPEVPEKMWPADAVIGWLDINGPSVLPYSITTQSVFAQDEDPLITLRNVSAVQDSERTIVAFIRSIKQGRVEIDVEEDMPINFAIGDVDALRFHREYGSSTILLSAEPGEGRTTAFRPPPLRESMGTESDSEEDAAPSAEASLPEVKSLSSASQDSAIASEPAPEVKSEAIASEGEEDEAAGLMLDDLK